MANSVRWYGHELREDGHVLRKALEFEVEGQRKKGRPKMTWEKAGYGRKCEDWLENGRCTLSVEGECWHKTDCCWVEVALATLTCWVYYRILNIDVSLSLYGSVFLMNSHIIYIYAYNTNIYIYVPTHT